MREGRNEDRPKLAGSIATNSAQLRLAHNIGVCGRCGAHKIDAQIGLEPTIGEHIAVMLGVFREIRRVLKPSGTVWLNYGDCYATSVNGRSAEATKAAGRDDRAFRDKPFSTIGTGPLTGDILDRPFREILNATKPKDLCMIPNALALALRADGWWVRAENLWGKPNPMPESIKDRPATAHEKVFQLAKAERYLYDAEAVKQGRTSDEDAPEFRGGSYVAGKPSGRRVVGNVRGRDTYGRHTLGPALPSGERRDKHEGHINHTSLDNTPRGQGRNLRQYEPAPMQVWEIATKSFGEAHFAAFPPELVERCLAAGCPKGGRVLDPFGGAGTTGLVADRLGLDCTLIDLSFAYAQMGQRRITRDAPLLADVRILFGEAGE